MATENVEHIEYRTGEDSLYESSMSLLPWQFHDKDNIEKLIYVVTTMKQKIDDTVVDIAKLRLIDTATGVLLDNIGQEVGLSRDGADDESYRILLKIRSFRRRSGGTRGEIADLIERFTGVDASYIEIYNGDAKTVDIAFNVGCSSILNSSTEITNILPILTSYRLLAKGGAVAFGFVSVNDDENTETEFKGFGSTLSPTKDAGTIASLITASK